MPGPLFARARARWAFGAFGVTLSRLPPALMTVCRLARRTIVPWTTALWARPLSRDGERQWNPALDGAVPDHDAAADRGAAEGGRGNEHLHPAAGSRNDEGVVGTVLGDDRAPERAGCRRRRRGGGNEPARVAPRRRRFMGVLSGGRWASP